MDVFEALDYAEEAILEMLPLVSGQSFVAKEDPVLAADVRYRADSLLECLAVARNRCLRRDSEGFAALVRPRPRKIRCRWLCRERGAVISWQTGSDDVFLRPGPLKGYVLIGKAKTAAEVRAMVTAQPGRWQQTKGHDLIEVFEWGRGGQV